MRSCRVILKVTGTISSTVVTLSKKAEASAVITNKAISIRLGFPFANLADFTAAYLKSPVSAVIPTIIIIPTSSPRVLKSI
ncbi:hypothetical protein D3C78_1672950 [compost metagenome]